MKLSRTFLRACLSVVLIREGLTSAWAYSLKDHGNITRVAMEEFSSCAPGVLHPLEEEGLIKGNLREDLDLPSKWALWSHFFHPEKKLKMRRRSSAQRIADLGARIALQAGEDFRVPMALVWHMGVLPMENVGNALHHIQDMASPPHVVPIMHGLSDGFESYEVPIPRPWRDECSFLEAAQGLSLAQILKDTASKTLKGARPASGLLRIKEDGRTVLVSWDAFWKEAAGEEFGQYGFLGNSFGKPSFTANNIPYEVPTAFYVEFKREQLRLAVEASKLALARVLRHRLPRATRP